MSLSYLVVATEPASLWFCPFMIIGLGACMSGKDKRDCVCVQSRFDLMNSEQAFAT